MNSIKELTLTNVGSKAFSKGEDFMSSMQFKLNMKIISFETIKAEMPKKPAVSQKRIYNPIKEIPSNFIAIDFETANNNRCSPCSVGVALVENGMIVNSFERLIKPHKDFSCFDDFNVAIHGITSKMVRKSPEFNQIMNELSPLLEGNLVVAHNMQFDCSVLCRTIELYGIKYPKCKTLCSVCISRIAYPQLSSHRLNIVSKFLNIKLDHHHAESDAISSAKIILEAKKTHNELIASSGYSYGYINEEGNWSPQIQNKEIKEHKLFDKWSQKEERKSMFEGCNFVFTGTLSSMSRKVAQELVQKAGGKASESITKETEFLVMGTQDYSKFTDGLKSSKTKIAEDLKINGSPIEIISEEDFLNMVDWI